MKRVSKVELKQGKFFILDDKDFFSLNSKGFGFQDNDLKYLMAYEAAYLLELGKISLIYKKEILDFNTLLLKKELDLDLFLVYRDLRSKGYYIGSAFRFGADFRVYEKGFGKEETHSKWLVKVVKEKDKLKFSDLSSSVRVAHSTHKKILHAIIDSENSITYYESEWLSL